MIQNIAGGTTGNVDAAQVQSIVSQLLASYVPEINGNINVNNITDLSQEFENLFATYVGADTIAAKVVESNEIFTNEATINRVLTVGTDRITTIAEGVITTAEINVKQIKGEKGDFDTLTAEILEAGYGEFEQLVVENSYIRNLQGDTAEFNSFIATYIRGENAEFDNLLARHITADAIAAHFATFDNVQITNLFANDAFIQHLQTETSASIQEIVDSEYVNNLVALNITAESIFGGRIVLSDDLQIVSENGALMMNGDVLQFGRKNGNDYEVGIQIGYGNDARPSLIIRDDDGAVLFTSQGIIGEDGQPIVKKGISADAIADGLIVNDMVGEGSLHLDRLSEPIVRANEHGGIDITQIYDGSGNQFGVTWTTFKNEMLSALDAVNVSVPTIEISGRQVYIERNGVVSPPTTDLYVSTKNGATIKDILVDGKSAFSEIDSLNLEVLTLNTATLFKNKDTVVIKVVSEDPAIYDIITLYKLVEGTPKYTVVISSSEGCLFTETKTTTCTCDVYYGSELIENNIGYEWIILNDNETEWQVLGNEKTLELDIDDNTVKRRLKCRVEI